MDFKKLDKDESFTKLAQENGLAFIVLFGSAATGALKEKSDIDIAFLSEKVVDKDFYFKFYDIVGQNFAGYRIVDLVDFRKTNSLLRYEITSRGILLYGDGLKFAQYRTMAFRDYVDSRSLFDLESLLVTKRQALLAEVAHIHD